MKAADITIGTDYEIAEGGSTYRATVIAVGKKTRRVYSGARWDFGGHESTGTVVTIRDGENERDVTPQAVKRTWADAAQGHADKAARKARSKDAAAALTAAGLNAFAAYGDNQSVNVTSLSVEDAERLTDALVRCEYNS